MKYFVFLTLCLSTFIMANHTQETHNSQHTFLVKTDLTKEQVQNLLNEYHRYGKNHTQFIQETRVFHQNETNPSHPDEHQNETTHLKVKKEKKNKAKEMKPETPKEAPIKGPEVKINGENLNIENKNNYGFLEGGTIIGDKESRSKDKKFDLYGIISGTPDYKPNNININMPAIKQRGGENEINIPNFGNQNLEIGGQLPDYKLGKTGISIKSDLNGPNFSGKAANIDINSQNINIPNPNINIKTNEINNNIGGININGPEIDLKKEEDFNIKGNMPGADLNFAGKDLKANIGLPNLDNKSLRLILKEKIWI